MFWLKIRMYLLVVILFSILYAVVSVISYQMGVTNFWFYLGLSLVIMFIQYMVGPKLVEWSMRVKYVDAREYPRLHQMVQDLARRANLPTPRIGIAQIAIPNAFAFGRWKSDGRICVTQGIMRLLDEEELRAVLGHEISHLRNRDVLTITLLSVIPIILYRIAWSMMYSRSNRRDGGNAVLVGLAAFLFYFITNLLVLYASRIREYFADQGSVELGSQPHFLASALYKLVYGSARLSREQLKETEGLKAFFVNDPSQALKEIRQLKDLDLDNSGSINANEMLALNHKEIKLGFGDRLMETLSTHPNMLKRIKRLSEIKTRA
ncbi:MAG: zinc metalloprotease HtpX [Candidatus Omnitrophota bacterium]